MTSSPHGLACSRAAAPCLCQFDIEVTANFTSQSPVAGEQSRVERFRKGDIDRVIGGEIVPQSPRALQKEVPFPFAAAGQS